MPFNNASLYSSFNRIPMILCKVFVETGKSFFANYLHKSMIAVNAVNELKYRIIDNEIIEFEKRPQKISTSNELVISSKD